MAMNKIITPDRRIKPVNEDALMGLTEAKLRDGILMIALAQLAESFHKHRKENNAFDLLSAMNHVCSVLEQERLSLKPVNTADSDVNVVYINNGAIGEEQLGELLELLLRYCWETKVNVAAELLTRHKEMIEGLSVVKEVPKEEVGGDVTS